MSKRKCAVIASVCLFTAVTPVLAYQTIDRERTCTLTVEGYPVDNVSFQAYKVAEITEDTHFEVIEPFIAAQVDLDAEEYKEAAATLSAYVDSEGIQPSYTTVTVDGSGSFGEVEQGLYLVTADMALSGNYVYRETPALVCVPYSADADAWTYDVVVNPKYTKGEATQKDLTYSVVKHWIDTGKNNRPASIQVNILKDKEVVETVTLDASNNWYYSWEAKDDGSVWQVAEKSVPSGYTVKITGTMTEFIITNTTGGNTPPDTGDTQNLTIPLICVIAAGAVVLALGIYLKKSR